MLSTRKVGPVEERTHRQGASKSPDEKPRSITCGRSAEVVGTWGPADARIQYGGDTKGCQEGRIEATGQAVETLGVRKHWNTSVNHLVRNQDGGCT